MRYLEEHPCHPFRNGWDGIPENRAGKSRCTPMETTAMRMPKTRRVP